MSLRRGYWIGIAATLSIGVMICPLPAEIVKAAIRFDRTDWTGVVGSPTCWPEGVVIHHTATPDAIAGHPVDVSLLDYLHSKRGFLTVFSGRVYHVGYHYVILSDGRIQSGRPESCEGAHAGRIEINRTYLGIALVGDFDSSNARAGARQQPTVEQLASLAALVRNLMARYHFSASRVVAHSNVNPTTRCPGDLFPFKEFLQHLKVAGHDGL